MIPGPIEFENEVLQSMARPTLGHTDPDFITIFANSLKLFKAVCQTNLGQAFIIAGTGTFAMEMAIANLIEKGDEVLVISTGYFGLRYAEMLKRYGANVDILEAAMGNIVPMKDIEAQLKTKNYKLLTFTHVDTSTAVLNDAQAIGALCKKYNVLSVLDGVCSVAGEEIKQDEWEIDVVLTASQKAIGVPPGLALLSVSPKAIEVFNQRQSLVPNYYADWSNWLPIMKAYENKQAAYFATPPVNLIFALEESLNIILKEGLDVRFKRHKENGAEMRAALRNLGLKMIPKSEAVSANTLSAVFYPDNIDASILKLINEKGVVLAGGLLPDIKQQYFRIGHMGSTSNNELSITIKAITSALEESGFNN
ncbi:MAG: alanine--glyoxylate aminotransferase family protein [Chitinophagales bacterium]|nr:alanine--glyoxylate aminotransferase family protein [Chitinophagales bacterium]